MHITKSDKDKYKVQNKFDAFTFQKGTRPEISGFGPGKETK